MSSIRFNISSTVVSSCIFFNASFPSLIAANTCTSFFFESIVCTICSTFNNCCSTDSTSRFFIWRIFKRFNAPFVFPSIFAFLARATIRASSRSNFVLYCCNLSRVTFKSSVARSAADISGFFFFDFGSLLLLLLLLNAVGLCRCGSYLGTELDSFHCKTERSLPPVVTTCVSDALKRTFVTCDEWPLPEEQLLPLEITG